MTNKQVVYGDHAVQRMEKRGFFRRDVKQMLRQGQSEVVGEQHNGTVFYATMKIRGQLAGMYWLEDGTRQLIITIEWVHRNAKKWTPTGKRKRRKP